MVVVEVRQGAGGEETRRGDEERRRRRRRRRRSKQLIFVREICPKVRGILPFFLCYD